MARFLKSALWLYRKKEKAVAKLSKGRQDKGLKGVFTKPVSPYGREEKFLKFWPGIVPNVKNPCLYPERRGYSRLKKGG